MVDLEIQLQYYNAKLKLEKCYWGEDSARFKSEKPTKDRRDFVRIKIEKLCFLKEKLYPNSLR